MEDNDSDFLFEENTARDFVKALLWYILQRSFLKYGYLRDK